MSWGNVINATTAASITEAIGWAADTYFSEHEEEKGSIMSMPIQPQHLTLSDLLAKRLFRIPEYQRCYSWSKRQRDDLFQDINNLKGEDEEATHFMATMVGLRKGRKRIVTDDFQEIEVVDGQQRLTTLIILYKAIAKALNPEDSSSNALRKEIESLLVKGDDLSLLLLQTNHDSNNYYVQYMRNGLYLKSTRRILWQMKH